MGQRHQLFAIAKVGEHYRSLAAVHHQWLYGLSAVRQCALILQIFGHGENRLALQQELRLAEEYYRDKDAPQDPPKLSWAEGGICPFPFITTCLMMGTSFNQETSHASVVHEEPFGMGFDQGDNNDGITVIDITDLNNVKYCFVNFTGDYADENGEPQGPLYQPLTGWQYIKNYYAEDNATVQARAHIPNSLDTKPLIDIATLAETWPWGQWELGDAAPRDTKQPDHQPVMKSLVEKSMEKMVEALLVSDDVDEFNAAKDQLQTIPNSAATLRKILPSRGDQVGKTPHSLWLLGFAYMGETHLDWGLFPNLDLAGLKSVFEAGSFASVELLNLSGTLTSQSPSELLPVLSGLTCLKSLYLMEKPDRLNDDSGAQVVLGLASLGICLSLEKLVVSSIMSISIRLKQWLPDITDAPTTLPGFPIAQLLVHHNNDDVNVRGQVVPYENFFLGDALLSPVRFVNGLLRYVQVLNSQRYIRGSGSGYELAACMALSSSEPGNKDVGEIGPLPATAYEYGKESYHSSLAHGYYSDMRNLKPGQWTVLLGRNAPPEGFQAPADKGFQYAFVRCKSEIKVRKPKDGERDEVKVDNLEVYSLREFLDETAQGSGSTGLEPLFNQLRLQVAKTDELPPDDGVLRRMSLEESRDLLLKFMDNIPQVDEVKEQVRLYR
ncbi:unnamed protein product [Clonostachys rosea]|uniref:Uncharacterized protein n=1 Tax=Bionectria ochroleuca TaxID=29856 RepID=A0ABY6UGY5_BIOOC|nr:unnamed protein product [Clonostachys rosea]